MSFRATTLVLAATSGGIALALACLPDLEIAPIAPACGNGIVDLDLGEECDPGDADASTCSNDCTHVLCTGGSIDARSKHCYFWGGQTGTLDLARSSCGAAGGHVVTFVSSDENVFATTNGQKADGAPPDGGIFRAWCSLQVAGGDDAGTPIFKNDTTSNSEPGWSHDCSGCYAHVEAGATVFPIPPEGGAQGSCVMWNSRSTVSPWYTTSCDQGMVIRRPTLCEREPVGSFTHKKDPQHPECGSDLCIVIRNTFHIKTYALLTARMSADAASAACNMKGGSLVMFDTPEEREQVVAEVARAGVPEVWIGLSSVSGGGWAWDDGKSRPLPWGDHEPQSGGRAFIKVSTDYDTRLAHSDDNPDASRGAVCELLAAGATGGDN